MEKPIVACIQHRLTVSENAADYDAHLSRFLRMAKAKGAVLALFPELSGLGTAIPTFTGWRNSLLKKSKGQQTGLWQRTKAKLAGGAANLTRADLHQTLLETLSAMPESLQDAYVSGFSNLARQYEMTIVAGSLYELEPQSNTIQNVSLVFGPDGALLGRQAKAVLSERDQAVSHPTEGWGVIPTPAGRVGILLGNDALYPEPARILAYQGADMLLSMGAVTRPATYHKIRQAAQARCQENQLYGMVSFLVGPDPFAESDAPQFVGKSAIFAPLDFTPRFSGVMVEVGSPLAEGVYPALEALWQESDTPLRREIPLLQAGPILANVYGSALALSDAEQLMLEAPVMVLEDEEPMAETAESASLETEDGANDYDSQSSDSQPLPALHTLLPDATIAVEDEYKEGSEAEELDLPAAEAIVTQVESETSPEDVAMVDEPEPEAGESAQLVEPEDASSDDVTEPEESADSDPDLDDLPPPPAVEPPLEVGPPPDLNPPLSDDPIDAPMESSGPAVIATPESDEESQPWWKRYLP